MSKEAVLKFREAINEDFSLQRNLMEASKEEGFSMVAFASENGFEFTPEELREVAESVEELTEFEMELIAGGTGDPMGTLFSVYTSSIEEANDDKAYYVEKLSMMNDMAEAQGDYLKGLTGSSGGTSSSGCGG